MSRSTAEPTAPSRKPFLASAEFWRNLTLGVSMLLTALTGLVIGWFAIHLQFFGEIADADDHEMAAGAYGAAALLLLLGAMAAWAWAAPRWQISLALGAAGLLTILALSAVSGIASAEPGGGFGGWIDGAGGVIACPWTWPLVVLGLWGPLRGRRARTRPSVRTE